MSAEERAKALYAELVIHWRDSNKDAPFDPVPLIAKHILLDREDQKGK